MILYDIAIDYKSLYGKQAKKTLSKRKFSAFFNVILALLMNYYYKSQSA